MPTPRISRKVNEFNVYINSTDAYQLQVDPATGIPNWQRLGLTATESAEWTSKRVYWRDTLFPKYSNPETSSSPVKKQVQNFIRDFRAFANPLLDRMAVGGAVSVADGAAFNFVVERDTVPTPRGKINHTPLAGFQPLGGGELRVRVRTNEDASRASRHPLADGVEIRWAIITPPSGTQEPIPPSPPAPGAGTTPPATIEQCPHSHISKKALFVLETGRENKNKMLCAFFRWVNFSNSANNGPLERAV